MRQRRPDWDREQREQRAREHGRERARVDLAGEHELTALVEARRASADAIFHRLIEPARRIAASRIPKEQKPGLVAAAIEDAAGQAPTPEVAARIRQWWPRMLKRR